MGREERAFYLSLILSLLAVFVTYLLNRYAMHAPPPLDVVIYMLAFLIVSSMSLHMLLFRLSSRVLKISELLNAMISSWIELWHKVIKIPAAKPLTGADLRDLLAIPAIHIDKKLAAIALGSSGSSAHARRKRELLEKARKGEISLKEAEELKKMLEEQRREKEAAGDLLAAIALGLLIIFIIGIIAQLSREE